MIAVEIHCLHVKVTYALDEIGHGFCRLLESTKLNQLFHVYLLSDAGQRLGLVQPRLYQSEPSLTTGGMFLEPLTSIGALPIIRSRGCGSDAGQPTVPSSALDMEGLGG